MNTPATLQLACAKPTHVVIWTEDVPPSQGSGAAGPLIGMLMNKITELEQRFNALTATIIAQAQAQAAAPAPAPAAAPGLYFPQSLSPHLSGLNVEPIQSSSPGSVMAQTAQTAQPSQGGRATSVTSPRPEAEAEAEVYAETDLPEEAEEAFEEGVEEEEDDAEALEEFEWKGVTYYKDSDNQVYEKDEDGDLNDAPIGIWNEAKQKLQRYAKAA
jgi:hypothetical protein